MASYLQSWWYGTTTTNKRSVSITKEISPSSQATSQQSPSEAGLPSSPVAVAISLQDESKMDDDDDSVYDDTPPAFPSLNSIQRLDTPRGLKKTGTTDEELMPPPAIPARLAPSSSSYLSEPSSSIVGISPNRLPLPTQNILQIPSRPSGSSSTLQLPSSTIEGSPMLSKKREKVFLAPGHSPLDWAALKASGEDLRGTSTLMRITPSQLKKHRRRDDAWSAFNGKVYNITPYLSFHPGGVKELMRVAGRDGTELFASTHAWVNVEFMLDECMVGFLVPEPSSAA